MNIIKPRLIDLFDISISQERADFAIPLVRDDMPLYVDPFLLWKSPSQQDTSLHMAVIDSFNYLGFLVSNNREVEAIEQITELSECAEVGLGMAHNKIGKKINQATANSIVKLFSSIPSINKNGIMHIEEVQLLVDGISKDRISDFTCNYLKSFLVDYTIQQAEKFNIPLTLVSDVSIYNSKLHKIQQESLYLPVNPITDMPLLFVPKRWLRYIPWINYDNYYKASLIENIDEKMQKGKTVRSEIITYNRNNYDMVVTYIKEKERTFSDCKNDPLFMQIPIISAKRMLTKISILPTGKVDNSDKKYEEYTSELMASLMYPHLDYAVTQSRTDSNVLIRDLIFYNPREYPFLQEIFDLYDARQIVMELKNVESIERDHINQINRYMTDSFGRFGIIITRHTPTRPIQKNIIDLWSGQRKCILVITDNDLETMVSVFEDKQRKPIEVINKKYVEFQRSCPS